MTHLVPVLRPVLGSPFRRGDLYRRAGEIPSFHISPAALGHARDLITGAVLGTYNSASPAMAVGPDGLLFAPAANAPVIEYNPTTLACLGARIWGVVTNLSLQSENIGGASPWNTNNPGFVTYTSNAAVSPTGANNARRVVATADFSGPVQFTSATLGVSYTVSVFIKAVSSGSLDEIRLELFGYQLRFKISTQAFAQVNANFTAYGALNYGSGWYRLYATAAAPSTGSLAHAFYAYGSSDFYCFGSQFNTGPVAPYVPTTTTAASSTADVWSITGADFNRIYNQSAVTFYAEAEREVVPAGEFPTLIEARNNTSTEIAKISYITESLAGNRVLAGNVAQVETYLSNFTGIRRRRIASAFGTNDVAISANGSVPTTDTTATMAAPDRIYIGSNNGASTTNGYIRELAIFRSRRPNANLQVLTT